MAWEVRAYLDDGGSLTVCKVDTLEEVRAKINSIFFEGFNVEKEKIYSYYPARVIKKAEAYKRE